MISVVIPTLDAEQSLPMCLSALVPGAVDGLISEVLIADGGSRDRTLEISNDAGVRVIACEPGRGAQLVAGGGEATNAWLMFLHADTVLEPGWEIEVRSYIAKIERGARKDSAAAFRFALDDDGIAPRLLEGLVWLRSAFFGFPYGDQGLLVSRSLYDSVRGYRPIPLMEDIDIVRRLGWRRVRIMRTRAITSANRYRENGYVSRVFRNQACLLMYVFGFSPERISRMYCAKPEK